MCTRFAREDLSPDIHLFRIKAPEVARKARPGQFVIVRSDEKGECIPLTIADWDTEEGSVTMVFMEVGTTSKKLACLNAGDFLINFVGPLGRPTEIENFGTVVCVAGGFAIATIMPIARAIWSHPLRSSARYRRRPDIRHSRVQIAKRNSAARG